MDKKQWYKILGKPLKEINSAKDMIKEAQSWEYFYLKNGRLVDEDGYEVNKKFPKFKSVQDAENYLEKENIRGNVVGDWKNKRR